VIVSTTYVNEAQRATSVVLIERGRRVAAGTPDEVIAGVPGAVGVVRSGARPPGESWRWGRSWRVWAPDGNLPAGAEPRRPDFDDAVIVAQLELEAAVET
jgi:ABC-2 type transport system ATP-binding protein